MVILCYKPHQGKEEALRQLIRDHRDTLVEKGLVTSLTVSFALPLESAGRKFNPFDHKSSGSSALRLRLI